MNITILNGSPRKNGNTEIMAGEFARGAKENGHTVELINLAGKQIAGCKGWRRMYIGRIKGLSRSAARPQREVSKNLQISKKHTNWEKLCNLLPAV